MMNDETALYLRNLKDNDGNFLWRGSADTLMGKPVIITNEMLGYLAFEFVDGRLVRPEAIKVIQISE